MNKLLDSIQINGFEDAVDILKSAGLEDIFEKAHNVGEVHQNGKWVWTEFSPGKFDWRVKKKKKTQNTINSSVKMIKNDNSANGGKIVQQKQSVNSLITVQQAFNDVQTLNPSGSTISSLGNFVSSLNQQISDDKINSVKKYLPKDSLALKIINNNKGKFSDKQLWVISYELLKNEDYQKDLAKRLNEQKQKDNIKRQQKRQKRASKVLTKNKIDHNLKQNNVFKDGDRVSHSSYGEGSVLSQTEDTIKINFDEVGEKILLKKFAKIKKIDVWKE